MLQGWNATSILQSTKLTMYFYFGLCIQNHKLSNEFRDNAARIYLCPLASKLYLREWFLTMGLICQPLSDRIYTARDAWGDQESGFFQGSNYIFYWVFNSLPVFALTLAQDREYGFSKPVNCRFSWFSVTWITEYMQKGGVLEIYSCSSVLKGDWFQHLPQIAKSADAWVQ